MKLGDKIKSNYVPIGGQDILDGNYLKNSSVPLTSLIEFPSVDKKYVAGENITAGKACGLWGYIIDTNDPYHNAAQATYVNSANPTTNYDGSTPLQTNNAALHGLLSWTGLPAIPSGTGLTILKIEVIFKYNVFDGSPDQAIFDINTATFDETTATWNIKPTKGTEELGYGFTAGSGVKEGTWVELTSTQYNNLKTNGLTSRCLTTFALNFYDEDNASPPQIKVRFTYEIQDGKAYLALGLTQKYADAFRGIAQNTVLKGQDVVVRLEGIDKHQSGLTAYSNYELSDTPGSIQTGTTATWDKIIGNARSSTELQIKYTLIASTQI